MVSYVTYFCLILKICFYALILSSGMLFIIMKDVYNRVYQCLIHSGTLPAGDWLDVAQTCSRWGRCFAAFRTP